MLYSRGKHTLSKSTKLVQALEPQPRTDVCEELPPGFAVLTIQELVFCTSRCCLSGESVPLGNSATSRRNAVTFSTDTENARVLSLEIGCSAFDVEGSGSA